MKHFLLITTLCLVAHISLAQKTVNNSPLEIFKNKPYVLNQITKANSKGVSSAHKSESSNKRFSDGPEVKNISLPGGNGENNAHQILIDNSGNKYIIGRYLGNLELAGQTLEGSSSTTHFIAKYNTNGDLDYLKNLAEAESNSGSSFYYAELFDNGILVGFTSPGNFTFNGESFQQSQRSSVLAHLNFDGTTNWIRTFDNHRFGRIIDAPIAVSSDSIYISTGNTVILSLNNQGDQNKIFEVDQEFADNQVSALATQADSLIIAGHFYTQLEIGDIFLEGSNSYPASFIASIATTDYTVNWAHDNSGPSGNNPGDSYGNKLFINPNNNDIFLYGDMRNQITWEEEIITGYYIGTYLTRFLSDGTIDTTLLTQEGQIYDLNFSDNAIYVAINNVREINFEHSLSSSSLVEFDQDLSFIDSYSFPDLYTHYLSLYALYSSDQDLTVAGVADRNLLIFDINTSDLTSGNIITSDNKNSGFFDIRGYTKAENNTYLSANVVGSVELYDSIIDDSCSAVIAKVQSSNVVDWYLPLYNAENAYSNGHSFTYNYETDKIAFLGNSTASSLFIGDTEYNIEGNFLIQLDNNGVINWVRDLSQLTEVNSVQYDKNGNIYLAGQFSEEISFGDQTFAPNGFQDYFIMKLTAENSFEWFKAIGGENLSTYIAHITVKNEQLFFSGEYARASPTNITIDDQTIELSTPNGFNVLAGFNLEGSVNWLKTFGGDTINDGYNSESSCWATSLTPTKEDGFYMEGWFGYGNTIDTIQLTGDNAYSHFIARFDKDGSIEWAKPIYAANIGFNYSNIDTDENDNVYIQSNYQDSVRFENGTKYINNDDDFNLYQAKFSASGEIDWTKNIEIDYATPRSLDVAQEDVYTIVGTVQGEYNIHGETGNAYFGRSYIIDYCATPAIATQPIGSQLVMQEDTSSYTTEISDLNETEWMLTPESAGQIIFQEKDSVAIKWASDFEGEVLLSVAQSNGCTLSDFSTPLDIIVEPKPVTANESKIKQLLEIYPNPTEGQMHVGFRDSKTIHQLEVLELSGRKVFSVDVQKDSYQLDINSLESGVYLLKISTDNNAVTRTIIKK